MRSGFWKHLRRRSMLGLRFRRQQPIGPFIVDFYCTELSLVVEVDGTGHENQVEYDLRRKRCLEQRGYKVLRIGSEATVSEADDIPLLIKAACRERSGFGPVHIARVQPDQ